MNRNVFIGRVLPVIIAVIISVTATAYGFLIWHYYNPYFVVLPGGESGDVSEYSEKAGKNFNPRFAITFDRNKVDYENIKKYKRVKELLSDYYYKDIDENAMLEGSIAGMADSLKDPYTVYFTKEQMEIFNEKSQGSYVGIGVHITMDDNGLLTVIEPFDESPAKEVGIVKGDKIIKVDDKDVTTIRDENIIISMIKGEENTNVKITVYRPSEGKSIDFNVKRKKIKVTNIFSEVLPGNIGYIRISIFDNEIAKYFGNHLNGLLDKGIKGLVIDVRDNPGGDYDQVAAIADRLLPKGLIVYTEDKQGNRNEKNSDATELKMPMAVLVNGHSASASEVLSGAIKDHKKGTLIGTKTFGKGLVQAVVNLDDGSGLKVTIARYFTPSGECIQDKGIEPHIVIDLDKKYLETPVSQVPMEEDAQLKKALEVLNEQITK
ncbi:MAG: S41 family peptidase [Bacillota bacterium]